jgi:hypothetical protein
MWAPSALHSQLHYWLCYLGKTRVPTAQFPGIDPFSFPVFIQSGFILQSFILHSYFTFFSARFLSTRNLNPPSELPII